MSSYAVWACVTCGDERVWGQTKPLDGNTAFIVCLNDGCPAPTRLANVTGGAPGARVPVRVTLHRFVELAPVWVGPRSKLAVRE